MKIVSSIPLLFCGLLLSVGAVNGVSKAYAEGARITAPNMEAQGAVQDSQDASDLSGSWQVSWTAKRGGQRQATLQLKQNGSKLSGTFEAARGSVAASGSVHGNQISFTVKMPKRKVSFTGTVDGDKMSGTTEGGASWTATRQ